MRRSREVNEFFIRNYCGMLFDFSEFSDGEDVKCTYELKHPLLDRIRESYPIQKVSGGGSEFERALRLNRWLSPKLEHNPEYALSNEHRVVPQDAFSLLEYSFNKPEHSINCVAKSLILAACCLAVGIYARRVSLYPASPYDEDNHVVTEIYDKGLKKWIMLDATTGGYFSDGKEPLSVLEMRERFADMEPISVVLKRQDPKNLEELIERNHELNKYYVKNLFYIGVETKSTPTGGGEESYLIPKGFDVRKRFIRFSEFLLHCAEKENEGMLEGCRRFCKAAESFCPHYGTVKLWDAPIRNDMFE